ncbi:YafY family protein [Rhizobium lusitanum]|uniref:helix-turn-helix transcriptional regulator n=1 Tax=Rhizobium lusitanum TaxID=293958 RepID=UPI00160A91E0|nr:YafY family protein [Rhizobium lusitanum]
MARSDRLFRLLQLMRQMPPPIRAARLAEEMEVSLRSLYRDIDSLRAAGARIEGERGYGYRLIEDYALPPQTFTRSEIEVIALGLREIRAIGDPSMTVAAEAVQAKIAATLPDGREQQLLHAVSHVFKPHRRMNVPAIVDVVRRACWDEYALDIVYADRNAENSERTILPLAVVYTDHALTALAWCQVREDFRMFRLDRIQRAERTGHSFRPRRVPLLRTYISQLSAQAR